MLEEVNEEVRGVRWATIEEGDAKAHEEGDDDEAETSAEGVNESEPVNPSLWTQRQRGRGGKCEADDHKDDDTFTATFITHHSPSKTHSRQSPTRDPSDRSQNTARPGTRTCAARFF